MQFRISMASPFCGMEITLARENGKHLYPIYLEDLAVPPAFENFATMSDVSLPDGMTELYGGVFNRCMSLKKIKLPQNLTVLGESTFLDCVG